MEKYVCYDGKDHDGGCGKPCDGCPSYGVDRRQADRRKGRVSFRVWERREGFDRRRSRPKPRSLYHVVFRSGAFHLRDNQTSLALLLALFILLNIADFAFTLKALAAGFIEGNPVMDKLFDVSPVAAGGFKMALALLITALVWLFKRYRLILEMSILFLLAYMLLIGYHIYGAIRYY